MSETALLFFFMAFATFLFAMAAHIEANRYSDLMDTCAKQHSFYECELVAVPKGEK